MIELPRFAVGGVQPNLDLQSLLWGLLEAFGRLGIESQIFSSQSRFDDLGGLAAIDDRRMRHLDSWLMSPDVGRWLLAEGGQQSDLSIVIGRYGESIEGESASGGCLSQLCKTLQLPSIVVLDVSMIDPCNPPGLPEMTCGLLLTGCAGTQDLARWQTRLEALCGVPVWGGLCDGATGCLGASDGAESIREHREFIRFLGDDFVRHVRCGRLLSLARKAKPICAEDPWQRWRNRNGPLRVAVAYDEVFNCYFPDTMDCLEAMGAELIDFSPLRSESLPESVDLVWLGCGHPETCPDRLARNICLQRSLQSYVQGGGRVYAEGGGLAYVCETMHCDTGTYPMAGILSADAWYAPGCVQAVDLQLVGEPWIGRQRVRGYSSPCWVVSTRGRCVDYSAQSDCPLSLVGTDRVIGSRIHLHFASQPHLLQSIWSK